jgi:hypothetical protein
MRPTTGVSSEPRSGCGSTDGRGRAPGHRLPVGRGVRGTGLALWVLAGILLGIPGAIARPWPVIRLPAHAALPAHPAPWIRQLGQLLGIRREIPVPVALEILKGAFQRPWSSSPGKRNRLVCRFLPETGSHITDRLSLHCTTNARHLEIMRKEAGPVRSVQSGLLLDISHQALRKIFGELPPTRGRLEFDLVSGGRVLSRWILRGGVLLRSQAPGRPGSAPQAQRSIVLMSSGR